MRPRYETLKVTRGVFVTRDIKREVHIAQLSASTGEMYLPLCGVHFCVERVLRVRVSSKNFA